MYGHISCIILHVYEYLCVFMYIYTYLYIFMHEKFFSPGSLKLYSRRERERERS